MESDGSHTDITDQKGIEELLAETHKQKYSQCEDTPMMKSPLHEEFGYLGVDRPTADEVLDGRYQPPPGTNEYAEKLLQQLAMSDKAKRAPPAPKGIPVDTWQKFWRTAKERTASAPSPVNFSVLKAGAFSDIISTLDATMTEIPMISGYSPRRWRTATDTVLVKKPGVFLAHKLRTIVLFQADFNYLNKYVGKEMLKSAEDFGHLAQEQYGCRQGHKAIDQATNKRLTTDLLLLLREAGVLLSQDAKGCFDRIQHVIAGISMARSRVPKETIICMFSTLQNLEHNIRTAYGDSKITYGGDLWAVPLQGLGQGNGVGPSLWAIVSSPILDMLRAEGFGTFFHTAISGKTIKYVGFSFVDDTDQVQTGRYEGETSASIVDQMQQAVNMWEGGLSATGGALDPSKSHWYLIDFVWEHGEWRFARKEDMEANIHIRDRSGNVTQIKGLEVDEAHTTLGVMQCPSGNMEPTMKALKKKTSLWASQMKAGHLKKAEMWLSLTSTIWKSLMYPLNATTLSKKQCEEIMAPVMTVGLNGLGINRYLPRTLVHGTTEKQGLELPHLYTLQGIAHLEDVMIHPYLESLTGKMYEANLEQMLVDTGLGTNGLSASFEKYGSLTPGTWMAHLWQFLDEYNLQLRHHIKVPLRRRRDNYIIPALQQHCTTKQLQAVNRCRLYLQVMTVADLASADGYTILDSVMKGEKDLQRPHYYRWPTQHRPSEKDWKVWRNAITLSLTSFGNELRTPLGRWIDSNSEWTWFYCPNEERLYRRMDSDWEIWIPQRVRRQRRQQIFTRAANCTQPAKVMRRANVSLHPQHCRLLHFDDEEEAPELESNPTNLRTAIQTLEPSQKWSIQEVQLSEDDGNSLAVALMKGEAIAVSDGSFKDKFGTSAWTIRGQDETVFMTGVNISPGQPDNQSAFRSELSGLYGAVSAVNLICQVFRVESGAITAACDGESALNYVFDWENKFLRSSTPHLDLIAATRHLIKISPVQWNYRHVKGHQDDFAGPLDRWATLNVEMDSLAKAYWLKARDNSLIPNESIRYEPWSIWHNERKFIAPIRSALYAHIHNPLMDEYWQSRDRYKEDNQHTWDWEALKNAMTKTPITRRHWITKHASGWCSVGVMAKRWGLRPNDKCPRCDNVETARHVWSCQAEGALVVWDASLKRLELELGRLYTDPTISRLIISRLSNWKHRQPFGELPRHLPHRILAAVEDQDRIGWDSFLEGGVSRTWRYAQEGYLTFTSSPRSSLQWASALIRKLFDVAWDQWEHRNRILHDSNNKFDQAAVIQAELRIRQEFISGYGLLSPSDKGLFRPGLKRILARPLSLKLNWLQHVQTARAAWAQQAHPTWPPERRVMLQWLRDHSREP